MGDGDPASISGVCLGFRGVPMAWSSTSQHPQASLSLGCSRGELGVPPASLSGAGWTQGSPLALPRRKLPAGPPASLVLSTSSSPQLASCLLSVPPFPHPSSLSLPLSVPLNFRFPPSFPLPLSEGREKLGVSLGGLKLGTGFLLRCGFPKGPSPHSTLGAAPSERHHALSEEGGTKLCLSSLQPHV